MTTPFADFASPTTPANLTQSSVADFRRWCALQFQMPITKAYGGHYFSPSQALWIDALRISSPWNDPTRTVALAALIQASSKCAAAPGHTAQPFQPTRTAKRFLQESWEKDVVKHTRRAFAALAEMFAKRSGSAEVSDANEAAERLKSGDLAFIDPPYSGVHYSRFYHVLETIARGAAGEVSGIGRYPDADCRPRSRYSLKTDSLDALEQLLETIARRGAKAILTFPDHKCSNGLSGAAVRKMARKYFRLAEKCVKSKFSTLGGTGTNATSEEAGRDARQHADELILILHPLKGSRNRRFAAKRPALT